MTDQPKWRLIWTSASWVVRRGACLKQDVTMSLGYLRGPFQVWVYPGVERCSYAHVDSWASIHKLRPLASERGGAGRDRFWVRSRYECMSQPFPLFLRPSGGGKRRLLIYFYSFGVRSRYECKWRLIWTLGSWVVRRGACLKQDVTMSLFFW